MSNYWSSLSAVALVVLLADSVFAQADGVPVYPEGRGSRSNAPVMKALLELRNAGSLPVSKENIQEQMKRSSCKLDLPKPTTTRLESRELWKRARSSHLRIGWYYLCTKCDRWHLDLAGGYAIAKDVAATCAHVIKPVNIKQGYLVAADDIDRVYPVSEVLAHSPATDVAILRLKTDQLSPLPLSTDVYPGDEVACFSDPDGRRGFYSEGHVNRFVQRPFLRGKESAAQAAAGYDTSKTPVWLVCSTDWAPGSSGSAVIDQFGNAVGHVSEIETLVDPPRVPPAKNQSPKAEQAAPSPGTTIVFHDAIAANEVLALIKPAK